MGFIFLILQVSLSVCAIGYSLDPQDGDIRLVNGTTRHNGYLELYVNESWWGVCSGRPFVSNAANTTCRQLGFGLGEYRSRDHEPWFNYDLINVTCTRSYNHILRCQNEMLYEESCPNGLIYVTCKNESHPYEGQLRLLNGTYSSQGLLQVYLNNRWGTVCSRHFTNITADIACRQLGYTNAEYHGDYPWERVRYIWLRIFTCTNTTNTSCLKDCYTAPTIRNIYCSNRNDVFLACGYNRSLSHLITTDSCAIDIDELGVPIVAILIILFCVIVLSYLVVFIGRVVSAAYHNSNYYRSKEKVKLSKNSHYTKLNDNGLHNEDDIETT